MSCGTSKCVTVLLNILASLRGGEGIGNEAWLRVSVNEYVRGECSSHTTRVYFKTNDKSRKSTVVCVRQTDHQTCSKKLLTVRSLKAKK